MTNTDNTHPSDLLSSCRSHHAAQPMLLPLAPWYTRIGGWMADTSKLAALNLIQIRQGRRHVTTPSEFAAYAAAHEHESLDEYYALPAINNNTREPILPPADAPPRYDHAGLPVGYPVTWPSPHPGPFAANNHARVDFFPAGGRWPDAPTVFLLHGLMSVSDRGYRRWAQKFQRHGWNTCFVHLPYHYSRRPPGYFDGELTIGSDLLRTAEGIRQQVKELRQLRHAMELAGAREFGVWATSYGGWIGSLWACVEGGFRFIVLVEPIVDAHDVIWRSPAAYMIRRQLRRTNMTPDALGTPTIMRLTSATHQLPLDNPRHVLLLAGTYDTIVTSAGLRTLHMRWVGSHFTSAPQGHLGHILMRESLRQLESGGFLQIAA